MRIIHAIGQCDDHLGSGGEPFPVQVTITAEGKAADFRDASGARVEHLTDIETRESGKTLVIKGRSKTMQRDVGMAPEDSVVEWTLRNVEDLVQPATA